MFKCICIYILLIHPVTTNMSNNFYFSVEHYQIYHRNSLWCFTSLSTIFYSVISWRSVLLVEETGVPGENHRSVTSH